MRFVTLSAATGSCLLYHDFARRDGGSADQAQDISSRLFNINKLLLQASGVKDELDGPADQSAGTKGSTLGGGSGGGGSGSSGDSTILGAGMRRLCSRPRAPQPRLAVRQWHLDSEQWHLAEDTETSVVAALCVPSSWPADAAAYLARGLRDAFVQAHRPQLLSLASSANAASKASSSRASGSSSSSDAAPAAADAASRRPSGTSLSTSLPPPVPAQLPARLPARLLSFRATPAPALLTLQALKLVCRLAQEGMDALRAAGLRPCWLYFAHVDSFMGAHLRDIGAASQGGSRNDEGAGGATTAVAAARRKGLFKNVLSLLGVKGGAGKDKTATSGRVAGGAAGGKAAVAAAGGGGPGYEPGPVGHLQHLVLPAEDGDENPPKELQGAMWDATSIASAVMQVRPPPDQVTWPAASSQAERPDAGAQLPSEEGVLSFPELEDVELDLEFGTGSAAVRRFSVMCVRLQHALGVVAQPVGRSADGASSPAGSLSRVRHLLRPALCPMSSLFHCLGHWAPQEEVAAHRLLLRLLE